MSALNSKESLRKHLVYGASGSMALTVANTVLTLLLAILLANVLGVGNFGVYAFCLSVVQILSVPAMLGGQQLLVREVASYRVQGKFSYLRGLILFFRQWSLVASVTIALLGGGIGSFVYRGNPMLRPFLLAMCLIPLVTILTLQGAALRGLRHVLLGQFPMKLRPGLVIVLLGVILWGVGRDLSAQMALWAQIAACFILIVLSFLMLRNFLPPEAKKVIPEYETYRWLNSSLPFVFAGGMQILNNETSVILLGILKTPVDVGIFRAAQRGAMLIPFGLQAVNMTIGPTISELFAKGEMKNLQKMITRSIHAVMAFALPMSLLLILTGKWIIPTVFGPDFAPAYNPLIILCLGQLVNASMGSAGLILAMTGRERLSARGVAVATVIGLILNFALIPFFGSMGAAIGTSCSLVVWNILLFVWLYKETGIISSFISFGRKKT